MTVDSSNNAVLVQAGPADQEDIARFIKLLDANDAGAATNVVRVFRLKNAFADELAAVINQTLISNIYTQGLTNTQSGGTGTVARGSAVSRTSSVSRADRGSPAGSSPPGPGGHRGGAANTLTRTAGVTTKTTAAPSSIRRGGCSESGLLEDVHHAGRADQRAHRHRAGRDDEVGRGSN